ncbi:MAG: protoglobin domain-containing protein, partial [Candidatus Caldarchaeum sp.]
MSGEIPGYMYGSKDLPEAPVSDDEFKLLKKTVLFTDEDINYLRMAGDVLKDQVDDVLDLWYGWVGSHPHLVYYFGHRETSQP